MPDNIYQTPGAPSGRPSLYLPFYPSRFLGEPGVWGVPGSSAGLHRCLFLPKQTDGKREGDSQLGWCAVWQRGLSCRSPFFFFVLHLNILPLITRYQYNNLSTVFSLSQHTLAMAALLIWLLQSFSLHCLEIDTAPSLRGDISWHWLMSLHPALLTLLKSYFSLPAPLLFSFFQPRKHQTAQWSPTATATSASEAQRRPAVLKTLSPVRTVDAQVGHRWRGWLAGGRRSSVDAQFWKVSFVEYRFRIYYINKCKFRFLLRLKWMDHTGVFCFSPSTTNHVQ